MAMARSLRPLPLLLAAALGACGFYAVQVTHLAPPEKLAASDAGRVARMYLVFQAPPSYDADEGALSKAAGLLAAFGASDSGSYRPAWTGTRLDELAGRLAAELRTPSSAVVGWQVAHSTAAPPWLADFSPSSSLWLEPPSLEASQEAFEQEVSDGKKTVKVTKYRLHAELSLRWRLYAEPEHRPLAEGGYDGTVASEERSEAVDPKAWLEGRLWPCALRFTEPLKRALLAHEVRSGRALKRGDGLPRQAFERATQGHWDEAAGLWRQSAEADPKDWISPLNLGVWHELGGRWPEAKAEYRRALDRGAEKSDRARAEAWLAELEGMPGAGPPQASSAPAKAFFERRLAVLPFSNQSVDLGAPEALRAGVEAALRSRGYAVLSSTAVDAALLTKDIREGGQLGLLGPAELAALLGAERVLYGDVEEYGVVNVGVYYSRKVRLALKLFSKEGRLLWENTEQAKVQSGAKPKDAAAAFLTRTAEGLLSKAGKTYLKDETEAAVSLSVQALPAPIKD